MGKPRICIGENKGADQLRSNCEADQRVCFRYTNNTIPLLSKSKISKGIIVYEIFYFRKTYQMIYMYSQVNFFTATQRYCWVEFPLNEGSDPTWQWLVARTLSSENITKNFDMCYI